VQLVEEGDDLAVARLDLLENTLEAFLELAAVLRAGDHRGEVERDQPLVAQAFRHVAGNDALGEAFDDRGLSDAGLADEDRVVLGTAGKDLNHAPDLGVAPDDRIGLPVLRSRGEVDAVLLKRLKRLLGVGRGDPAIAATNDRECRDETLLGGTGLLELPGNGAAHAGQAGQDVLGRYVLVAQRPRDLLGRAESVDELARQRRLGHTGTRRTGQTLDSTGGGAPHIGRIRPDRTQQRGGGGSAGIEQRQQEMPRLDCGVAALGGDGDRGGDDLPALGGQALGVHVSLYLPGSD
jgi:hypothetical protein